MPRWYCSSACSSGRDPVSICRTMVSNSDMAASKVFGVDAGLVMMQSMGKTEGVMEKKQKTIIVKI